MVERRADRHDRIRYFLDQPGDLRRELADARGVPGHVFCRPTEAPPIWTACCFAAPQDGRVLGYDFKTGKRMWETTIADPKKGEVGAVGADRLGRPRLHRQCGRRLQGREGAHVRARRKDGQDRLGVLSGSQGRGRRRPRTAGRDARSTHRRGRTRPACPSAAAEPGRPTRSTRKPGCCTSPAAIRRPTSSIGVREGDNLFTDSVVVLDAKTGDYKTHFQIVPKDWHDWDVSNPPILIQTMGGKQLMAVAPKDGYLYGFDLAEQQSAVPRAGDPGRGCRRTLFARQGRPFLSGLGGGRGMEQPGLRSQDEPDHRRRGRMVRRR